jgi:hypothetical protein
MASGCSYVRYRVEDALEVVDVGITVSKQPTIGLYWNSLDIFPFGYSNINGYFVGYGGGHPVAMRHYNKCVGFGYAYQEIGWGDFDKDDPETLNRNYAGVLGYLLPPYKHDPAYSPACVHFSRTSAFLDWSGTPVTWRWWIFYLAGRLSTWPGTMAWKPASGSGRLKRSAHPSIEIRAGGT